MTKEFKEANLDTEPEKVIKQEITLLFERASKKFKIECIYHWNRILLASDRIQKEEIKQ